MFETIVADYRRHNSSLREGGFWALLVYRFGRWSLRSRTRHPVISRVGSLSYGQIKPLVAWITGTDLECTTTVGEGLHIVHSSGVSIHPRAVIGDRVGIMHGVTIGSNMGAAVPIIGNDVFIGCNASVLGGVKVGDGARIAANSLVISDVPAGAVAMGVPAKCIAGVSRLRETLAFNTMQLASATPGEDKGGVS